MHELLLYGQVPSSRHDQVLKILAGVAAMQPRRLLERRIIYKPLRDPEEPGSHLRRGGTQAVAVKQTKQTAAKDLYYSHLVQKLTDDDFDTGNETLSASIEPAAEPRWARVFQDIPDVGDRGVSIRYTTSTDIVSGDPHASMIGQEQNQFVSEYYVEGHRFVHGNIVIFLHRPLHEPGVRSLEMSPKSHIPPFTALQPLDPSGAYILEAKIRVQDYKNTTVLEAGVTELKRFQTSMKGCVELAVPDRLSLDTRVKYRPPPPRNMQGRPR